MLPPPDTLVEACRSVQRYRHPAPDRLLFEVEGEQVIANASHCQQNLTANIVHSEAHLQVVAADEALAQSQLAEALPLPKIWTRSLRPTTL